MEKETLTVLLEIVAHAILSNKKIHPKEAELFTNLVKAMGLEKEIPEDYSTLPPLESLVEKLNTKVKRLEALSLCMDAIAASEEVDEHEEAFLRRLCSLLGLTESATNRYVEIAKSMAKVKNDFYLFLEEEYSDTR